MSETPTLGPCTECGTPRDACTAPDYCCDECLHFPPDWDGYATTPVTAAEPTGDVREQIARVYYTWPGDASFTAELFADAVLALPAVRDALAAQETVRRVEALHSPTDSGTGPQCRGCATHVTFTRWPCKTIDALAGDS